eukprot:141291_1
MEQNWSCFILVHIGLFLLFSTYSHKDSLIIAFILFSNAPLCSLATSTYQYNSTIGGARMPRADKGMNVGLNPNDGTILLFGGKDNPGQFVQFDPLTNTFTDMGSTYFTTDCYARAQTYAQIENTLWMISDRSDFIKVNVQTYDVEYPSISIPLTVERLACLASLDTYLFVVGGWDGSVARTSLQIYNTMSGVWINGTPSLQTKRDTLACAVVNEHLYAIAGWYESNSYLDTIEVLNVGGDLQSTSVQWRYMNDTFTNPSDGLRAVQRDDHIIVIGGYDAYGKVESADVYIIDTVAQTISICGTLEVGLSHGASIIYGNTLYIFGGSEEGGETEFSDRHQYITLPPTAAPTLSPTTASQSPSSNPFFIPRNSPTNYPTVAPSSNPTLSPTSDPTLPPSIHPTLVPTASPSNTHIITAMPSISMDATGSTNENESPIDIELMMVVAVGILIFIIAILLLLLGYCRHIERRKRVQKNKTMVQKGLQQSVKMMNNNVPSDVIEEDERMDNEEDSIDSLYVNKDGNQEQATKGGVAKEVQWMKGFGEQKTDKGSEEIGGQREKEVEMGYTNEGPNDIENEGPHHVEKTKRIDIT